jgi:hypothetical protein
MFRSIMKVAVLGLMLMMALGVRPATAAEDESNNNPPVTGKKQAYMGDPAQHRGVELGFDRGYFAAKADQEKGLSPDLGRHELYNDPNPMYRYEFGNRGNFNHGFRSGFFVGYRQGWGDVQVGYVAPHPGEPGGVQMLGMEAEAMGPGAGKSATQPGNSKGQAKPPTRSQVLSDAL